MAQFEWGSEQQTTFDKIQEVIQEHMELHPMHPGPVELHVTLERHVALWSL